MATSMVTYMQCVFFNLVIVFNGNYVVNPISLLCLVYHWIHTIEHNPTITNYQSLPSHRSSFTIKRIANYCGTRKQNINEIMAVYLRFKPLTLEFFENGLF
eukprot:819899_1